VSEVKKEGIWEKAIWNGASMNEDVARSSDQSCVEWLEHETLTSEKEPGRVEKVWDGGLAAVGRQKGEPVINTWEV